MILQPIIFPRENICKEIGLYYRNIDSFQTVPFVLKTGQEIKFNTYFNSFSIDTWKRYTQIENLFLKLHIKGCCQIDLYESYLVESDIKENLLVSLKKNKTSDEILLDFPAIEKIHGFCYFSIKAQEESCTFVAASYCTNRSSDFVTPVKIGLGICTYKRESFVLNTLKMLQESYLDNEKSSLFNKLEIFISDNGLTLSQFNIVHPNIRIVPNINTGGSGGFARCMIEACLAKDALNLTHFVLMDDDIVFHPEVLERTYYFLQLLQPKFTSWVLGGAMLSLENRTLQLRGGYHVNSEGIISRYNSNMDLLSPKKVLLNEKYADLNFSPWVYCCLPIDYVNLSNLPLPFFIHHDDAEFGYRIKANIMLLNGVCVWHSFQNKNNLCTMYCDVRNPALFQIFHSENHQIFSKKIMLFKFFSCMTRFQYLEWSGISKAFIDLKKGWKYWANKDFVEFYNKAIMERYLTVDSVPSFIKPINPRKEESLGKFYKQWGVAQKIIYIFGLITILIPGIKDPQIVSSQNYLLARFCWFRKGIYIKSGESYLYLKKSYRLFVKSFILLLQVMLSGTLSEKEIVEYQKAYPYLKSYDFWKDYLRLL